MAYFFHLGDVKPSMVVKFINKNFEPYKGVAFYSLKEKNLKSKKPNEVQFYYDAFHGVLEIKPTNNI